MLSIIGNLIWWIFGGLIMALGWFLTGCLLFVSIIGIPWARSAFVIAKFSLIPFGRTLVRRDLVTGEQDIGTSDFGIVGNIIWFLFAGWWLCLGHIMSALACFITIIGIPWGWQHLKLAGFTLAPIGLTSIPVEDAERLHGVRR